MQIIFESVVQTDQKRETEKLSSLLNSFFVHSHMTNPIIVLIGLCSTVYLWLSLSVNMNLSQTFSVFTFRLGEHRNLLRKVSDSP